MTPESPQSTPNEELASALPQPPRPGPRGRTARLATPADEDRLTALLETLSRHESPPPDTDRIRWATQTLLRRPVHGFVALAESDPGAGVDGVAVVSVHLDPVRGWTGELTRFWIPSEETGARRATATWFLEEVLEMARYHGINRVRLPAEAVSNLDQSGGGRPPWLAVSGEWATLRPHFDAEPDPDART